MKTPYLKHFQFYKVLMLAEDTGVICIQIGAASDNDWRKLFACNRKRSSPRIEPCGTPYLNVLASEKTLSIQTKSFLFERRTQTI